MKRPFTALAVVLLLLIAIVQFLRFMFGWEITINGLSLPVWASAVAGVIAAGLAAMIWMELRK